MLFMSLGSFLNLFWSDNLSTPADAGRMLWERRQPSFQQRVATHQYFRFSGRHGRYFELQTVVLKKHTQEWFEVSFLKPY